MTFTDNLIPTLFSEPFANTVLVCVLGHLSTLVNKACPTMDDISRISTYLMIFSASAFIFVTYICPKTSFYTTTKESADAEETGIEPSENPHPDKYPIELVGKISKIFSGATLFFLCTSIPLNIDSIGIIPRIPVICMLIAMYLYLDKVKTKVEEKAEGKESEKSNYV
ncbi:MAG: hypothetical protein MHPSP_002551 [Paramarteilia canceri]